MVKNENFVTIQGWMVNEFQLKGNELLIYAIIYGFCQDDNQKFCGSLQYLADWTNSTKQGVIKNLKSLLDKKLIEKNEKIINNVKVCEYYVTKFNGIKQSLIGGIKQSLPNIYNNIHIVKEIDSNKLLSKESSKNNGLNEELFNRFYKAYPKHKNKGDAEKVFKKINPSEDLVNLMVDKINILKNSKDWKKENGQYIPYPSTWLNNKGWEDEVSQEEDPYAEYIRV